MLLNSTQCLCLSQNNSCPVSVLVGSKPASISMEQEHHQLLIVHDGNEEEEVEDVSLKRTLPHGKDNLATCVVTSSSSSSSSSPASNGVCTVVTDPNGSSLQKEEEVEEIRNVGENSNHFNDDCAAVVLGLVAEFVGAETNGYGGAITGATFGADVSQNKNSVYFDKQQGSPVIEKSQKDVDKTTEIVKISDSSLRQEAQSQQVQPLDSTVVASDVASNKPSSGIDADVIVIVDDGEAIESTTFQTTDNVTVDGAITTASQTQVGIGEQPRDEIGEPRLWEALKSIVYGGLVESITSLGIVSCAASSGATPSNIIALGIPNLIGGLLILGDNLKDLKNDHYGWQQLQTNAQDRYQEQLGRRENFLLHAVAAVLSFLIFGSVPLVIYGLLVKFAIVAATSVVCIILLAIGKVYTRRPPKSYIKTVLHYVTMALATSGLSYMAGNLFKDLLEKFDHFVLIGVLFLYRFVFYGIFIFHRLFRVYSSSLRIGSRV